ncbi:L-ribulose-5-phosphate 4-epimerase [Corynebacterium choanae]|uniref:L-ribulose-5-phosphate 4-epimerase n=1 Tax=Corynebacterium choanae TaxID=1862358 RepID=A0A3G6J5B2_9CORY|nr:L-ribulose-5-phosphate 4-epimerase [Corynebacterium choanae]AZA13227.1 L-ribulose-5-phosphate 4-epimerase UlaF [Corynebacterium choanae]
MTSTPKDLLEAIVEIRKQLCVLHQQLVTNSLVVWTAGNVSQRVPDAELFVIKASGVRYETMTDDDMVVCDLDGNPVDQFNTVDRKPSSDTAAHAYVYRHMADVGGVVHTHSPYATAFAAARKPIPCVLTMTGDEFGGEIPIGPLALIGDDAIGRGIVDTLSNSKSPAVLMANHGPFTIGEDATAAVKAAVMVEEVAKTTLFADVLGPLQPLEPAVIDRLHDRYQHVYGQ